MEELATKVRDYYQAAVPDQDALLERFTEMVDNMGSGLKRSADLSGMDQFHVGGLAATAEFARRVGIEKDCRVLDAGCGLGGPARYLAETFGCHVTGVDLTPSYVAVTNLLTAKAGLESLVNAQVGDLTNLEFPSGWFDLVWTQHVVMNIHDREALYRELRRVLKPGGRLAFYDALAANAKPDVFYPTPWAETAETSALMTEAETRAVLKASAFEVRSWEDVSKEAGGWLSQQRPALTPGGGPGLVVGPRIGEMVANFGRNLKEGRLRLVMAVCDAV